MLPLSAYREAIHLDEPFPTPIDDPRSDVDLLRVALAGLPNRRYPDINPDRAICTDAGLASALRFELVIREPGPLDEEVAEAINILLKRHSAHLGRTTAANLMRIHEMIPTSDYGSAHNVAMWRGDVRELVVDAVVNAAMPSLMGCTDPMHPCIDNYIQGQGGPWMRNDCSTIRQLQGSDDEVGGAKITRGYRLPAKYVLHTVSPQLRGGQVTPEARQALANCYTSCLDLALEKGDVHSISFCALSTGKNNFPFEEATHIALDAVDQWLQHHGTDVIELVVFNIFEDEDAEGYMQALSNWVED
ncbi:MAG: macro domain-containing protein [Actinomycetaceae bacterium]|nr:macro domain-containing protein [Actinomycetaceae bacterium]